MRLESLRMIGGMRLRFPLRTLASLLVWACAIAMSSSASAQNAARGVDMRTQYPALLANSFFSVGVGGMDYEFSSAQLTPGFRVATVQTPHAAARIGLFGHEFNRYVSVQASYMRPGSFVAYQNVNGDETAHHVWMALGAVTMKTRLPITQKAGVYGEGGFGITSRHGFSSLHSAIVPDVHYASIVAGGGIDYQVSPSWSLVAGTLVAPGRRAAEESPTLMTSVGFQYTMRRLPPERVEANAQSGFHFPANVIQLETSTAFGYGVNRFFSKSIFWDGSVRVDRGEALHLVHNVFHTRRVFGFDVGASGSAWRSQAQRDGFYTLSVYPQFRFTFLHTHPADVWAAYSVAGPTFLSRAVIDGQNMGARFTFQDFMGLGTFFGHERRISAGVKINHYSNGNMFTRNAAVTVPITVDVGYAF